LVSLASQGAVQFGYCLGKPEDIFDIQLANNGFVKVCYNLAHPAVQCCKVLRIEIFYGFYKPRAGAQTAMKNIYEVLREKEMDLARLRIEVDALRFVVPLLVERSTEPSQDQGVHQPDLTWSPALEKNKWPLKVGQSAPTYSDS
jgi:hypothetical protein